MSAEAVLTVVGSSFGATLAAVVALTVTMVRLQHRDSRENRELIGKNRDLIEAASRENRDLIEAASRENRELMERARRENRDLIEAASRENRELIGKNRDLIGKNRELIGDARERLARIEGHLRIVQPAPEAPEDNGDNREAA